MRLPQLPATFKPEEVTAWQDAVDEAEHPEHQVDRTPSAPIAATP